MLDLPRTVSIKGRDGKMHDGVRMWKYWCLEEGTLGVDPNMHKTNDGKMPPVIHVDTDAPLYSDVDGRLAHRQAVGPLLQARLQFRRRAGRRLALQGRDRARQGRDRSLWPRLARLHRRRRLHRDLVLDARALPEALRGQDRRSTRRTRNRAASAASRPTISRSSTSSARMSSSSPIPTTATR